jgi:hypothetical protein
VLVRSFRYVGADDAAVLGSAAQDTVPWVADR